MTTTPLSALLLTLVGLAPGHHPAQPPDVIPPGMHSISVERSVDLSQLRERCCVSYVLQKGDTLASIAQRQLGGPRRMQELLELNPGLKPAAMTIGRRIWLPARDPAAPRRFLYLAHWGPQSDVTPFAATDSYPTYWALRWGFVVVDEDHRAALLARTAPKKGTRGRSKVEETVLEMAKAKELLFLPVKTTSAVVKTGSGITRKVEQIQLLCDDKGRVSTRCKLRSFDKKGRELSAGGRRDQSLLLLLGLVGAGWLALSRRRRVATAAA